MLKNISLKSIHELTTLYNTAQMLGWHKKGQKVLSFKFAKNRKNPTACLTKFNFKDNRLWINPTHNVRIAPLFRSANGRNHLI